MVKFKLSVPEIRNFKARITDRLIHRYIEKELSKKLEGVGFDIAFSIDQPFLPWGTPAIYIMAGMNPQEVEWNSV